MFETKHYIVEKIDGDYAHLRQTDEGKNDTILVAMALLPIDIMEESKLIYENLEYSILD